MKKIIYLLAFVLLAANAFALGVMPSEKTLLFEQGKEETVQLKILNNEKNDFTAEVYAEGDLANYIQFDKTTVIFTKNDDSIVISYTIKFPEKLERPGKHNTQIVVKSVLGAGEGDTLIQARLAVGSKLIVDVPYTGKYAEAKLFVANFEQGKGSNFVVEAKNLGTEDILDAQAVIDIYGPQGDKLATIKSDIVSIPSKRKANIGIPWTPELGSGLYRASAILVYDNLQAYDTKTFTIGEIMIDITSIDVKKFTFGGIAKFDINLSSKWNMPIQAVYADTYVKDKSGKTYTQYKTATTDIDAFGKQEISAYWDTDKVIPGAYIMEIALNYLGKRTENSFDIIVDFNEIRTSPAGMAIAPKFQETNTSSNWVYILAILVAMLLAFNIFMRFWKKRRKN